MELPKNITQIGEADKHCRIYVEDYVVSYIKQMNGMAQNKDIAIALYGRKTAEDGVAYLFAYGSAKLNFLQKPVRHLSQAQEQEIEKLRWTSWPWPATLPRWPRCCRWRGCPARDCCP